MVVDDIVLNKSAAIERCLKRIKSVCPDNPESLLQDETALDAVVLNLQRACENGIDLAMHLARLKRLGIPQSSRDAFELLAEANIISRELLARMKAMIGFRNIAIHEYHKLDTQIVVSIVRSRLEDFHELLVAVKKA